MQVCWAAPGTSSLNSTPIFCSGVWVACSFPDPSKVCFKLRCKLGKKMALKTLFLVLEGSVRSWIGASSVQGPSAAYLICAAAAVPCVCVLRTSCETGYFITHAKNGNRNTPCSKITPKPKIKHKKSCSSQQNFRAW